jgi:hypothetical protein
MISGERLYHLMLIVDDNDKALLDITSPTTGLRLSVCRGPLTVSDG